MDEIRIDNLKIFANHGVYEEENERGQNFYVNAVLYCHTRAAGVTDDLELSTNYGEVCQFIDRFMKSNTFHLIETVSEKCAEALLLHFPLVREIILEVRKPEAPIPLPFESVSVKITRGWKKAYIACGSNMGNRRQYLDNAVKAVSEDEKCRILRVSDFVETAPYGGVEQEDFLNGAMAIETLYTPEELLIMLQKIELLNNRERLIHWGPRTLDLDILLYENTVLYTDLLKIPHVDMQNRDFVLEPLSQIAPYEIHPLFGKPVFLLLQELREKENR